MVESVSPVASEIMCRWKVRWISMAVPWDNRDGSGEQLGGALPAIPFSPSNRGKFFTDSLVSRK
jgi:hypothetical protein